MVKNLEIFNNNKIKVTKDLTLIFIKVILIMGENFIKSFFTKVKKEESFL